MSLRRPLMDERFIRTALLLGEDAVNSLERRRVAVFGAGGVGGYVIEALARSGIGAIDIIDADTVAVSNINRQIIATEETIGMKKTHAAALRVKSINPKCDVKEWDMFFLPENAEKIDFSVYDYVVDAVDTVAAKIEIILRAKEAGVKVVSAMGAGNKLSAAGFKVADIYKTKNCPLARVMRHELKKRGVKDLKVVYSEETARKPFDIKTQEKTQKRQTPGSVAFVPAAAGLVLAGEVVLTLGGAYEMQL